jgi:hypothetical protein
MSSSGRSDVRSVRLRSFFKKIVTGEESLVNLQQSKLFIQAICDQSEPVRCIENLISSQKGLSALQCALHLDISPAAFKTCAIPIIRYLQAPELKIICTGEFLQRIVLHIVDPPVFWNAFVSAHKAGRLEEAGVQCLSWLLLQLVSLPADKASPYHELAKDSAVQSPLLESLIPEVRTIGQRIKHILETSASPGQFGMNGPGGRHDNDFKDIRNISILPTPDELASTEPPFLRRAVDVEDCAESTRLAMHIDNQFRLNREDMVRDLREELQIALGAKKGRRKGLIISNLSLDGVECDDRRPWALRLKPFDDLPQIPKGNSAQRKQFFIENRNYLKHESLACIVADRKPVSLVTINRKEDLLAHSPPLLCVSFSGGEPSFQRALLCLKSASQIQLVQLNAAVFAYEPILRQLQATKELSLRDEILYWEKGKPLATASTSKTPSFQRLLLELENNATHDLQDLLKLTKPTKLDKSQAACLLAGVSQRLSLVQGPPGNISNLTLRQRTDVYRNWQVFHRCFDRKIYLYVFDPKNPSGMLHEPRPGPILGGHLGYRHSSDKHRASWFSCKVKSQDSALGSLEPVK